MQAKWLVVSRGRELGEFASRYAAMVFAERLHLKDGPCSVVRRPLESVSRKTGGNRQPSLRSLSQSNRQLG